MDDEPAYHIDIDGIDVPGATAGRRDGRARPWVGIHFDCCGVYNRIYRNAEGTAYRGYCPKCAKKVSLRVGDGGTDARFFLAE